MTPAAGCRLTAASAAIFNYNLERNKRFSLLLNGFTEIVVSKREGRHPQN